MFGGGSTSSSRQRKTCCIDIIQPRNLCSLAQNPEEIQKCLPWPGGMSWERKRCHGRTLQTSFNPGTCAPWARTRNRFRSVFLGPGGCHGWYDDMCEIKVTSNSKPTSVTQSMHQFRPNQQRCLCCRWGSVGLGWLGLGWLGLGSKRLLLLD